MTLRRQTLKHKLASLAVILAIVVIGTGWLVKRAKAQDKISGYLAYGLIGIGSGQTLRLNAVTVGVGHEVPVELTFLDRNGEVISRTVERLQPGRAVSLDLGFAPGAHGNHLPVRALIRWMTQLGSGYVIPSLEVVDDGTGKTIALALNPEG